MSSPQSNPSDPVELYYEAQRLRNEGNPKSAIQCYGECLELLHRTKDVLAEIRILMEMEELFEVREEHTKAMNCLKICLEYAEELGQKYEKSIVLHRMGHLFYRKDKYEKALERFNDSMQLSRSLGDQRGFGLSRAMLGKIQLSLGEVNEGLGMMVESLSTLYALKAPEWDILKDQIRAFSKRIPRSMYELIVRTKTDNTEVISLLLS